MMITPEQIAETIAAALDGDWDDGLEAYIEAAAEGSEIIVITKGDDPEGDGLVVTGGFTVKVSESQT